MVCVKQVPQTDKVRINPDTNTLIREGVESILNPFDEFAVEEAVQIRERLGGEVGVVSMGPPQTEEAIKTCLAMGADKGYLLADPCLIGSDTLATSFALSRIMRKLGFDLILCGQETTDSGTGQVGPELAEFLGIPQVTFASKMDFVNAGGELSIVVKRETDRGYQIIKSTLPALVSVSKEINTPRGPRESYSTASIIKLDASYLNCDRKRLGAEGSPTQVFKLTTVTHTKRQHVMLDSQLPAHERLQHLITGGITKKDNSTKLHDSPVEVAAKAADFITDVLST
jgi:electron transfer flavoprotein beta subunit